MKFRSYAYTIIGLMVLLIVLLSVSSQQSVTYRSKAQVQTEQTVSSLSQSVVQLSDTDRGICVKEFTYLPTSADTQTSCFVQFACVDSVQNDSIPQACVIENTGLTCESTAPCKTVLEWTQLARRYCGCDE